jgi:hypothetical protein
MPYSLPLIPWSKSLLSERKSHTLISTVLSNTLDLMMLGFTNDATRLIIELNKHNAFQFESEYTTMRCLHYAWDARSWPDCVQHPDERKPSYIYHRVAGEGGTSKEFIDQLDAKSRAEWQSNPLAEKYPKFEMSDLNTAISELNSKTPEERRNSYGANSVACAVEIALVLGEEAQAEDLVKKHVVSAFIDLDGAEGDVENSQYRKWRQDVAQSRRFWKSPISHILGKELEVDEEAVRHYVDEGISIIASRLVNGPENRFAKYSITELVKLMDKNYIAARLANPDAGEHMTVDDFDPANVPSSFLRAGATDEEVENLEKALQTSLPNDYKEFLGISNGFHDGEPKSQTSILYGTAGVEFDETIADTGAELELLPYCFTSLKLMDEFNWPEIGNTFSIGACGDEGSAWMIPRSRIEVALEEFERVYEEAEERDKRIYEKAAMDIYGGIDKMRDMQWLIITWMHWSPDPEPHGGFRAYLEDEVQVSIQRREEDEADKLKGLKRKRDEDSDDGSHGDGESEMSDEDRSDEDQ